MYNVSDKAMLMMWRTTFFMKLMKKTVSRDNLCPLSKNWPKYKPLMEWKSVNHWAKYSILILIFDVHVSV